MLFSHKRNSNKTKKATSFLRSPITILLTLRSDRDSNSGTACDGYTLSRNTSFSHKPLIISVYYFVLIVFVGYLSV